MSYWNMSVDMLWHSGNSVAAAPGEACRIHRDGGVEMRHDHGIRIGGALLVTVLMAASSLLMAASALAQTKLALVWGQVDNACCNAGGTYPGFYPVYGSAIVGSTPSTPSVMIRSGFFSRVSTYTWTGPLTPYSVNYIDAHNAAVTFKKSHSLAPTATTTVRAADKTSTAVGGDFYFPRYGTMMQKPGTHRFGGTMGIVSNLYAYGKYAASVGYYSFYGSANPTSMLHGPVSVGQYGFALTGMFTHSTLEYKGQPLAFDGPAIVTNMPSTTGTQYLYQPFGYYVTQYTWAGYDNRTPDGLNGTLSLVRPYVQQYFWVVDAPPFPYVALSETQGFMTRITLTFLPEPGSPLMLGCGILTLAGLFRLRMR
jgi:hypothetical protein